MAELDELRIADKKHIGLAEMLKGGVIMDVTTAEQAKIAEDAGATSVMALERVPADIRRDGGVARMASVKKIKEIQKAVSIPVMAKARIGHFVEARILEALAVDFIDESEVLTPADEHFHIDKFAFRVPFVCGARDLGEALRRIGEGAAMIRTKGEAGSGNIVEAVRHMRALTSGIRRLTTLSPEELMTEAKNLGAPYELVRWVARAGKLPVPNFSAGGIATPADAALMMQLGAGAGFVGPWIIQVSQPARRARASTRSWSASPRRSRTWPGSSFRVASPPRCSGSWASGSSCRRSRSSTRPASPSSAPARASSCWRARSRTRASSPWGSSTSPSSATPTAVSASLSRRRAQPSSTAGACRSRWFSSGRRASVGSAPASSHSPSTAGRQ